jgi:predicted ATP-grasp superfamily ATP-dependent carboligase
MLDTTRPVIVLDGGSRADLGLVRSLGMARIPVHLLTWQRSSVTGESRYVKQTHAFPQFGADDNERVARMRAIARSLPARPVVLASGDRALRFLSRCRGMFEDVIDHDLAPPRVIDSCLDKARFARLAEPLAFPVPASWSPSSMSGALALCDTLTYPLFVKPLRTERATATGQGAGVPGKGWQVRSPAALMERCRLLETSGVRRVIIQEYVPGPDSGLVSVHVYVEPSGRVAGTFTGKKLRCCPPDAGIGTHVVSERDDALVATSIRILAQLAYTGFAILQYKQDARDGTMKLLEINCRYGTWTELPSRSGCNFPAAAYAAITRQRVPVLDQRDGMAWLDLARDFEAFASYRRNGSWGWRGYLRSLTGVRCWAFFAPDDPAPFFWQLWRRAAQ